MDPDKHQVRHPNIVASRIHIDSTLELRSLLTVLAESRAGGFETGPGVETLGMMIRAGLMGVEIGRFVSGKVGGGA